MLRDDPSGQELVDLLVQLGRAAYAEAPSSELTAAQWAALRYCARANRFSRTVSGFAEFHATTRGTASQTIRSLVDRGLLTRQRSDRDGRSVLFDLTAAGRKLLRADPLAAVVRAVERLDGEQRHALDATLRNLKVWLTEERALSSAGVCQRCGHLIEVDGGFRCGLLNEKLAPVELAQLCQRFAAPE